MKCKYCNSNIDIDTEVCPYCGKENHIAKKHREDMAKYSEDYKATKEDVLKNSKKFNRKTFRTTAVAITVAFIAISFCLVIFNFDIADTVYHIKKDRESSKYADQIFELMEADDYLGLTRLVNSEEISYYSIPELKDIYMSVYVARNYSNLFSEVMKTVKDDETHSSYFVENVNNALVQIYKYASMECDDELYVRFCNDAKRDALLLLEYYLDMPKVKTEALEGMTDGQRILAIEEAYYAKLER